MADRNIQPMQWLSRRGFVKKVGAGGLLAAAAVAVPERAAADVRPQYDYFCCRLAVAPTWPYSNCSNNADYIWGCYSGSSFCSCCEDYDYPRASVSCYP